MYLAADLTHTSTYVYICSLGLFGFGCTDTNPSPPLYPNTSNFTPSLKLTFTFTLRYMRVQQTVCIRVILNRLGVGRVLTKEETRLTFNATDEENKELVKYMFLLV